ncbi:hypothetical protein A374_02509 [Fictibacillus macauensis ZFHKF-1]|uniref:ABC transmembrane type-2 domain-containing protein n=1 Tax=Fictibacillus macauensis ZFHKF-1 TaxID=1196324 RepID=I8AN01_9BACL|nr:ABC transporter permease [Fictibacillus macauensis]EIT87089.1 hypothetical protein A374_02509 [Fictibacillus macauensis ZFHKF-1]
MKEIWWLVATSLRGIIKNKKKLLVYLVVPVIGVLIGLAAYGNDGRSSLSIGIVNNDHGILSGETISYLKKTNHLQLSNIAPAALQKKVANSELDGAIIIDANFTRDLQSNKIPSVKIISIKGATVTAFVKRAINQHVHTLMQLRNASNGNNATFEKRLAQYKERSYTLSQTNVENVGQNHKISNQATGFLLMILLTAAGGLSELIIKERERRTFLRIMAAPVSGLQYVISNVLVSIVVMVVQIVIMLFFLSTVFSVSPGLPLWEMGGILLLFSLAGIGLSLTITAFSSSSTMASALNNLIFVPTCLLAGCFWPVEVMPKAMQKIADFLPQRWVLDTLTQLQKGHSFASIVVNLAVIAAFALAFFMIASYKFNRNNSVQSYI